MSRESIANRRSRRRVPCKRHRTCARRAVAQTMHLAQGIDHGHARCAERRHGAPSAAAAMPMAAAQRRPMVPKVSGHVGNIEFGGGGIGMPMAEIAAAIASRSRRKQRPGNPSSTPSAITSLKTSPRGCPTPDRSNSPVRSNMLAFRVLITLSATLPG